jgi:hypothetical protein
MLGIVDGLSAQIKRDFCISPGTADEILRDTVKSFLLAHPGYLKYPAAYQVATALEQKFPCGDSAKINDGPPHVGLTPKTDMPDLRMDVR